MDEFPGQQEWSVQLVKEGPFVGDPHVVLENEGQDVKPPPHKTGSDTQSVERQKEYSVINF